MNDHVAEGGRIFGADSVRASSRDHAEWHLQERRDIVTEQQRLMNTLFRHEGREHIDVKFMRGRASDLSPEDLCREANRALLLIDGGFAEGDETFTESLKPVNVRTLVAAL